MLDNSLQALTDVTRSSRAGGLVQNQQKAQITHVCAAGDLFDGTLLLQDTGAEMWEVDRPDRKMMVVWGTDVDMFDPETQVNRQPKSGADTTDIGPTCAFRHQHHC